MLTEAWLQLFYSHIILHTLNKQSKKYNRGHSKAHVAYKYSRLGIVNLIKKQTSLKKPEKNEFL